ncbi:hypothetical protein QF023_002537 [Chryseobacterium sp. SLBN-27]|uniref:hypothetical protein n=1 Tax=Chryseobacterium sp. SLBN-27 TaxID=3042287 RepID=UPI0025848E88|nr:hypothetical protein [Chryseobacterium sp. SLBN-27]MDR6159021.1 hypothetical protein [Chryseobacterium sp. SLBN-27]
MIKKKLLTVAIALAALAVNAQVGINTTTPNPKSALDVVSKNRNTGTLLTRLSSTERDNIAPGASENGLTIFNTTTNCYDIWVWDTTSAKGDWKSLCGQEQGNVDFTDCSLISVSGAYDINKPISQQNIYINIPVRVTKLGTYNYTATVNGITFIASGSFTSLGNQNVILYPSSGTPGAVGTYNATVTIKPTITDANGIICTNVPVTFLTRSTSKLVVVNINGSNTSTGLITGCNHSSGNAGGKIGDWLTGGAAPAGGSVGSALSYAGTQSIEVKCVSPTSATAVSDALVNASIVYLNGRSSSQYNSATVSLVKDWVNSGRGILIDQGDEINELPFSEALGYFVEADASGTATVIPANLSQVLVSPTGYTLPYTTPTSVPRQASNQAFIATNVAGTVKYGVRTSDSSRNLMVANIDNNSGVFIFGDKYGENGDVATAQLLTNVFAWALHNVPVYGN